MKNFTLDELIKKTTETLKNSPFVENAAQESWWMVQELTKKSKSELLLEVMVELSDQQEKQLSRWIHQRVYESKPLQYILGHMPFINLDIITKQPVLIPRVETEQWCEQLIERLRKLYLVESKVEIRILDLCCGSGAIALAFAKAFPTSHIVGVDIDPKAVALAEENKRHNKVENVDFFLSNLYREVENRNLKFDLIVSNPPYVAEEEWESLDEEIKKWESKLALVTDNRGLSIIKKIIEDAPKFLIEKSVLTRHKFPRIALEIGETQSNDVVLLLKNAGFKSIEIHKDLTDRDRLICAL